MLQRVVLVKTSSGWGSGVLVHGQLGLVLTCAHVLNLATLVDVAVDTSSGRTWLKADAVFQNTATPAFDVAVLVIRNKRKLSSLVNEPDPAIARSENGKSFLIFCQQSECFFIRYFLFVKGLHASLSVMRSSSHTNRCPPRLHPG